MAKPVLNEILIFSGRKELVEAVKSSSKSLKLKNIRVESESEMQSFINTAQSRRDLCLILDLERGVTPVVKILQEETRIENRHARPAMLFAPEISDHFVELATEFLVSQVHSGPISESSVKLAVQELFNEIDSTADFQVQLSQVSIARDQDEWEDAMDILKDLQAKYPGHPRVTLEIAENLMHGDQWSQAYDLLQPLMDEGTKDPRILNMIGRCLLKLNKPMEASHALKSAHLLNPFNVDRLIELGHIYMQLDKSQEARESFLEARRLDPENQEVEKGLAQSCLIDGEINEGLKILRNASSKRELASIFNTAGILCVRRGQMEKALRLYETAIKALAGEERMLAKIFFNSGVAYYRLGEEEKALAFFEKAVKADANMTKARHNAKVLGAAVVNPGEHVKSGSNAEHAASHDLDDEDEFL